MTEAIRVHEKAGVALALVATIPEDIRALAGQTVVGVSSTASSTRRVATVAGSDGSVHVEAVVAGADSTSQSRIVVARCALVVARPVAGCTRPVTSTAGHRSSRTVVVEESVGAVASGISRQPGVASCRAGCAVPKRVGRSDTSSALSVAAEAESDGVH